MQLKELFNFTVVIDLVNNMFYNIVRILCQLILLNAHMIDKSAMTPNKLFNKCSSLSSRTHQHRNLIGFVYISWKVRLDAVLLHFESFELEVGQRLLILDEFLKGCIVFDYVSVGLFAKVIEFGECF